MCSIEFQLKKFFQGSVLSNLNFFLTTSTTITIAVSFIQRSFHQSNTNNGCSTSSTSKSDIHYFDAKTNDHDDGCNIQRHERKSRRHRRWKTWWTTKMWEVRSTSRYISNPNSFLLSLTHIFNIIYHQQIII